MTNSRHRQFILLSGEAGWCRDQAQHLLSGKRATWISATPPRGVEALAPGQVNRLLGGELDALVFDAHPGFDANAFGAVTGALRGGGVLIVLTPELSAWADQAQADSGIIQIQGHVSSSKNRFISRLSRLLRTSTGLIRISQGELLPVLEARLLVSDWSTTANEQAQAIEAVMRVAHGHRRRPLVLVADRGRGKSAAFGIAAARLLRSGAQRILVTAPRMDAVNALFRHAADELPLCQHSRGLITLEQQRIEFVAPDALLGNPRTADLLLVDEAAGIPAPLLQQLLADYSRIAFATTVHGYEGTGRGFAVRFNRVLDQLTPQWKSLTLDQPIRWAADDPLEKFTFSALLLDAEPAADELLQDASLDEIVMERLPRDMLLEEESLLRQLFGLLVIAHYRTTPADLVHLLDGANIAVWVARHRGVVAAAVLMATEGGLDKSLAEAIWEGKRRPHGHLLPQTLASKAGLREAGLLRYQRIIRIAVHPALQGRGLGTRLLGFLENHSRQQHMDFIGSSFGATAELLKFWQRAGLRPVRLGMRREASSGAHSALLLRPLSAAGTALYELARKRFLRQYPAQLAEPLSGLDAGVALALLESTSQPGLSGAELQELKIFADAGRDYADSLYVLQKLALLECADELLPMAGRKLLLIKVLQGRDWQDTARLTGLSGRRQVLRELRELVRSCLA